LTTVRGNKLASTINANTSSGLISSGDTSGILKLQTASTDAVTIDASQNVGIGTTSPTQKLNVSGAATTNPSILLSEVSGSSLQMISGASDSFIGTTGSTPLRLGTAFTERMRIDTSGNLLVGTTSSSQQSGTFGQTLKGSNPGLTLSGTEASARIYTIYEGGGALSFFDGTAGAERMRIDSSGNLGVGTSSPTTKLQVNFSDAAGNLVNLVGDGATAGTAIATNWNTGNAYFDIRLGGGSSAYTKARIDSSGSLLIGTISNSGYGGLITASAATSSFNLMTLRDTGTTYGSGQVYALFQNSGGSTAGSIQHTASTTVNYSTSSDARLKTSLGLATDTSVVDNIIIHDFQWIEDGRIDRGVFAQEANEVKPSAVSIGKDDLTEDGNLISPWGVDYSKFVPDLIVHAQQLKKQVQELKEIVDTQAAKIAALEAK